MTCSLCGAQNSESARRCASCGRRLRPACRRRPGTAPGDVYSKVLAAGFGLVFLALVVAFIVSVPERPRVADAPGRSLPQLVSLAAQRVASKFLCGCGRCSGGELATCGCPTATQARALIDQALERGLPEGEVLALVEGRYGQIKEAYAPLLEGEDAARTPSGESRAKP